MQRQAGCRENNARNNAADGAWMNFAKGASLADPSGLFNSSPEGDRLDKKALKTLIRTAVAFNETSARGWSAVREAWGPPFPGLVIRPSR